MLIVTVYCCYSLSLMLFFFLSFCQSTHSGFQKIELPANAFGSRHTINVTPIYRLTPREKKKFMHGAEYWRKLS